MAYFSTSDGVKLHYTDQGDGLPLICLPGLTRCGKDFRYFAPHAARYRMITLDARGRGGSDHAADYMSYNVLREASDVLELMDHLALPKAAILGTSRGGLVAMTLATTSKDRLMAVILNDIGPEIAPGGIGRIMDYLGRSPSAKSHAQAAITLSSMMAEDFPTVGADRWLEEVETFYDLGPDGLELRYDPRLRDALIAQAEGNSAPDLWPMFLSLSGLPTGAIRGENSDLLSTETFATMQEKMTDLHAIEAKGRGHVPFLDEPEALALIHSVLEQAS